MIALRLKDGVEIENGDSQIRQIGKARSHPGDVSTEKIVSQDLPCTFILIVLRRILPRTVKDGPRLLRPSAACPAKTIGKDLIHDGAAKPCRRICPLIVNGNLKRRRRFGRRLPQASQLFSIIAIVESFPVYREDEIIPDQTALWGQQDGRSQKTGAVSCRGRSQRVEPFPLVVLPDTDLSYGRLRPRDPDAQPQRCSGRTRPGGETVSRVLRIMRQINFLPHAVVLPDLPLLYA